MSSRKLFQIGSIGRTHRTRAIRATVATGSLVAIIVLGLPWVDEYLRLRREAMEFDDLSVQLTESEFRQEQLDRIEEKISGELQRSIAQTTDPQNTQRVREQLIEFVREAGGRVRRLEIEVGQTRPWATAGDDPREDSMPIDQQESRFVLHTHTVELQAEGSLTAVQQVLERVANQGWLMTTENLTVMPTGKPQSPVKLEIQLILYGLGLSETDPEDQFALRDANSNLL